MIRDKLKEKTIQKSTDFRFRGTDNTRVEALSDGVFALAFALLVISTSIPKTYVELINFLDDLVPFSICIVLLMVIWYQHYVYFIRYGFKDATIVTINTFLLIMILFYIYPLKFLFQILYTMFKAMLTRDQALFDEIFTTILPIDKAPSLMIIYGIGATVIFLILAWMYHLAYKRRDKLELTEVETFDTRSSFFNNLLMSSIPALSVVISLVGQGNNFTFTASGMIYWVYPVIMPIFGTVRAKKRAKLVKSIEENRV